jgi:hypothetical protein
MLFICPNVAPLRRLIRQARCWHPWSSILPAHSLNPPHTQRHCALPHRRAIMAQKLHSGGVAYRHGVSTACRRAH